MTCALVRRLAMCLALPIVVAGPAAGHTCPADCNGDSRVLIDELVVAVRIALEESALDACAPADSDGDGRVVVNELVLGVASALGACAAATAATPTDTATTVTPTPSPMATGHTPVWTARRPLSAPRQELGVAELLGRVYTVGGFDDAGQPTSRVEYYDPVGDEWFAAASLPQALHHVPVAAVDGRLYALGGLRGGAFTAVDLVFEYDPARNAWDARAPLLSPRGAAAAAVIDGRIYLAGGLRNLVSIGDFAVLDPATNAWTPLPAMPTARDHLAAAAIDGRFYAVGGRAGQLFDALEVYDPATREWTTMAPMPTARGGLAAAAFGGRLFTFGGEGNSAAPQGIFPQVEVYDPGRDRWDSLPDLPTPRHGMGAAVVGDQIYVPGGATVAGFQASDANEALRP